MPDKLIVLPEPSSPSCLLSLLPSSVDKNLEFPSLGKPFYYF